MLNNIKTFIDYSTMWSTKFEDVFVPEIFSSLLIMLGILILAIVIHFKFKKAIKDPLATPKGFVFVISQVVMVIDKFV